ncbi:hypothetical protein [Paludibaculum fermentans]|uniref:NHL domain-containing protein n=1 Tax=Paludibaculum fermentans TaxID=1473598 RepID=UPI003EB7454E
MKRTRYLGFALAACLASRAMAEPDGECVIRTVAGRIELKAGDPRPAILERIDGRMAMGPGGALYVATRSAVYRISDGVLYPIAGIGGSGEATGNEGPARDAGFASISGIAIGPDESVYLFDAAQVRRIGPDGIIHAFAGTGRAGFLGDGGQAAAARVQASGRLAVDSFGNVLISDTQNYRIRKVTTDGIIRTIAGVGGGNGPVGDEGPAASAQLGQPSDIGIDAAGRAYFIDGYRIRMIDAEGMIHAYAGTASGAPGIPPPMVTGGFREIQALAVDGAANAVYFADLSYSGSNLWRAATAGGTAALPHSTARATGLAAGPAEGLYLSEYGRIWKLSSSGALEVIAGGDGNEAADGVPATMVPIAPTSVITDEAGRLYFSDGRTNRVREVGQDGLIRTVAGGGKGHGENEVPAASVALEYPGLLARDGQGNLYVSEGWRIRRITRDGTIQTVVGGGPKLDIAEGDTAAGINLYNLNGLTVDPAGNIYFAIYAGARIWKVTGDGIVHVFAGTGEPYSNQPAADVPAREAQVYAPKRFVFDSAGTFWFIDASGVRTVGPDGILRTVTQYGAPGYASDASQSLAVDAALKLYLTTGFRVVRVEPDEVMRTLAGGFEAGDSGDEGAPEQAKLRSVSGLWADAADRLYLMDGQRIRQIANLSRCSAPAIPEFSPGPLLPEPGAPGKRVTFTGFNLGPGTSVTATPDAAGQFPTELAGTRVAVNGVAAPLVSAQNKAVTAVLPYAAVTGSVLVEYRGVASQPGSLEIWPRSLKFFTSGAAANGNSNPPAFALNEDGTQNSEAHPAAAGSVIAVFLTGEGETVPAGEDGKAALDPLPRPAVPIEFKLVDPKTLAGWWQMRTLEAAFTGMVPGEIGRMQVNLRIPEGTAAGLYTVWAYPAMVTIFVK